MVRGAACDAIDGAYVDDGSATRAEQRRELMPHRQPYTARVGGHHVVPHVLIGALQRRHVTAHARGIHRQVEPAELLDGALHRAGDGALVPHVGGQEQRSCPRTLQRLARQRSFCLIARGDGDARPARAKASAVASPMPEAPPVMKATLSA